MNGLTQYMLINGLSAVLMIVAMRLILRPGRLFPAGCAVIAALLAYVVVRPEILPYSATIFLIPQFLFAVLCFDEPPSHALAASALYSLLGGLLMCLPTGAAYRLFGVELMSMSHLEPAAPGVLALSLVILAAGMIAAAAVIRRFRLWLHMPPAATGTLLFVNFLLTAMSDTVRGSGQYRDIFSPVIVIALLTLLCLICLMLVREARHTALRTDLFAQRRRFELTYRRELDAERERLARFCRESLGELDALRDAVRDGRTGEAAQMLDALDARVDAPLGPILSGNPAVDALLRAKRADALRGGCRFEAALDLRECGALSDPDAVAILANLVDNALAACREGDAVSVRALVQRGVAVFEVRNPAHGDGDLPSVFRLPPHPARRHGIGLASVRRTAERYGGSLTLREENGFVTARAVLNV